ncbi:hypothetical protein COCNU_04G016020 [Cocos nucifera]|uniref:DUF547 domain-containing protein n=1 Tax=Cocos nucifera TaxID=13894 RepID=A0A8K0I7H1_COCNU|nr:hypothetical protein COCNU_04G016020 [Cocos nucifera]
MELGQQAVASQAKQWKPARMDGLQKPRGVTETPGFEISNGRRGDNLPRKKSGRPEIVSTSRVESKERMELSATAPAVAKTTEALSMQVRRPERNPRDEEAERLIRCNGPNHDLSFLDAETRNESPNKLSEELIKILISIFHKLNQTSTQLNWELTAVPKLNISCMSSRSFVSKSSSNCKTPMHSLKDTANMLDPYGVLPDADGTARDIRLYKKFIDFTQSSFDMSRISLCLSAIGRLRVLMHKLCNAKLSSLTYKQKLAFWINIYNACIMHHGLPPSPDKLLALLNKGLDLKHLGKFTQIFAKHAYK